METLQRLPILLHFNFVHLFQLSFYYNKKTEITQPIVSIKVSDLYLFELVKKIDATFFCLAHYCGSYLFHIKKRAWLYPLFLIFSGKSLFLKCLETKNVSTTLLSARTMLTHCRPPIDWNEHIRFAFSERVSTVWFYFLILFFPTQSSKSVEWIFAWYREFINFFFLETFLNIFLVFSKIIWHV